MKTTIRKFVFILGGVWVLFAAWQVVAHHRAVNLARGNLLAHARDMSRTLSVVIRSGRRFHTISKERLEAALKELSETGELLGVVLQNPSGDIVTQAGQPVPRESLASEIGDTRWEKRTLTLVDLISLGSNGQDADSDGGVLLMERSSHSGDRRPRNDGAASPPEAPTPKDPAEPQSETTKREPLSSDRHREMSERFRRMREYHKLPPDQRPKHPPWMTQEEFDALFATQGLKRMVMLLDAEPVYEMVRRDLQLRLVLCLIAAAALAGIGLWQKTLTKNTSLEVRLARAREMNRNLRDMNTAAAGLAHETRNPLNRIRGLSQLIANDEKLPDDVHERSTLIVEEVDRVAGRLHDFIEFSRPREPLMTTVQLDTLVKNLLCMLEADLQEKHITVNHQGLNVYVEADENLLRRMIFNLLLNAIQAVPDNGQIVVTASHQLTSACLSIADNGPGVPEEERDHVFQPYVTLTEQGAGLGLAIVRQIALAHRWEIALEASDTGGANFVISKIQCKSSVS